VKVAEWSDETRFLPVAAKFTRLRNNVEFEKNKTYIVTTILEEPYIMERKGENNEKFEGNDRYEGYCKDLAELVAKKLGITCKLLYLADPTNFSLLF
jgi:glutamate receptor, ionotropic, invertebrate